MGYISSEKTLSVTWHESGLLLQRKTMMNKTLSQAEN